MPTRSPVQYTIRGIPCEVDRELRRKAQERKVSLNQLLVEELIHVTGTSQKRKYRSVKSLGGRWIAGPEFDRVIADQRKIDADLWR